MTKKTSESFFGFIPQPNDFCPHIDNVINAIVDVERIIDQIDEKNDVDFYLNLDLQKFEKLQFDKAVFEQLISGMKEWFNSWLLTFQTVGNQEQDFSFKIEFVGEHILFTAIRDRFTNVSNFFLNDFSQRFDEIQTNVSLLKDELNNLKERLKTETPTTLSFIDFEVISYEIGKDLKIFNHMLELLRESAANTRECVNKDLKLKTKIQLFRTNNEEFKAFISDNHSYLFNDLLRDSYKNFFNSISRDYLN